MNPSNWNIHTIYLANMGSGLSFIGLTLLSLLIILSDAASEINQTNYEFGISEDAKRKSQSNIKWYAQWNAQIVIFWLSLIYLVLMIIFNILMIIWTSVNQTYNVAILGTFVSSLLYFMIISSYLFGKMLDGDDSIIIYFIQRQRYIKNKFKQQSGYSFRKFNNFVKVINWLTNNHFIIDEEWLLGTKKLRTKKEKVNKVYKVVLINDVFNNKYQYQLTIVSNDVKYDLMNLDNYQRINQLHKQVINKLINNDSLPKDYFHIPKWIINCDQNLASVEVKTKDGFYCQIFNLRDVNLFEMMF